MTVETALVWLKKNVGLVMILEKAKYSRNDNPGRSYIRARRLKCTSCFPSFMVEEPVKTMFISSVNFIRQKTPGMVGGALDKILRKP